jgi:hypothetical protein
VTSRAIDRDEVHQDQIMPELVLAANPFVVIEEIAAAAEPAFYSYAYPGPSGYAGRPVRPEGASYNRDLGEFIIPVEAVRTAADPDAAVLDFCQSTYEAAADLGGWDRAALERPVR